VARLIRWFVKFWTLDTVKEWRCLKATQLQDFVVDLYPQVEGDDPADENHVLTDKKFLYEVRERSSTKQYFTSDSFLHGRHGRNTY